MPFVIDVSADAEIVIDTAPGRRLPASFLGPRSGGRRRIFYAEVLAVVRRRLVIDRLITESRSATAVDGRRRWHVHRVVVAPLIGAACG
jgi:hypothetical protein